MTLLFIHKIFKLNIITPIACESSRSFLIKEIMNRNYNKHLFIVCIILFIIAMILIAITKHNRTDYEVCGIDSAYIVDSLGEEYSNVTIDTIIKTDINGNVYRTTH